MYKKKVDTKYNNKTSCSRNICKIKYNENKIKKAIYNKKAKEKEQAFNMATLSY
jgi:hypothetical protein